MSIYKQVAYVRLENSCVLTEISSAMETTLAAINQQNIIVLFQISFAKYFLQDIQSVCSLLLLFLFGVFERIC